MESISKEKSFWIMIGLVIAAILAFLLFNAAQVPPGLAAETRIVPITRIVPVTELVPIAIEVPQTPYPLPSVQGIRLVPMTVIVEATQAIKIIQVVPVTRIIPITRIIDIPEHIPATQAPPAPPAIPAPTEAPAVPAPTEAPAATEVLPPTAILPTQRPSPILPPGSLFFSAGDFLYQMNLANAEIQIVSSGVLGSEYLAADAYAGKVYLTRWDQPGQILAFNALNPRPVTVYSDGPASGGQGLVIDATSRRLYLGLYYSGVFTLDMNNPNRWVQIVSSNALSPLLGEKGQMAVDHANRHVYFRTAFNGDCGECRYLWRVDFNGENLVKLFRANGGDALALDLAARKLYFSELPGDYTIKRANLDGSNVETLLTIPPPYQYCRTMALDLPNHKMYLSLFSTENSGWRAIARANTDGTGFEILYQILGNSASEASGGMALLTP
jgi:hypothetical protein